MKQSEIDRLVRTAVFGDDTTKKISREEIRRLAFQSGAFPASIDKLYQSAGRGEYIGSTVPAINLRGMTYNAARAVFRSAIRDKVGPFIFEIARSEIGYTRQEPDEYAVCILAAALRENFKGPVFLQGDHFQVSRSKFLSQQASELIAIKNLIRDAVAAGFFNIDIDASTVVDLNKSTLEDQQEQNCRISAEMTKYIRDIQPKGVSISIGGEIGEVGGRNSTVKDLQAFMTGYKKLLPPDVRGPSKISIQTGTTHGGVVLPDGSLASIDIDFKTLKKLSQVARGDFHLGGAVQHGASTLPDSAFALFPQAEAIEVHLATGFQNIIMDSPSFPGELKDMIRRHLVEKYAPERIKTDTEEQFIYKTRKKAFGDFKREIWDLPQDVLQDISEQLEERFSLIFQKLNINNSLGLLSRL